MEPDAKDTTVATAIATHPLFRDLAPRYQALLQEVSMVREFAPNELIFHEGEPANRFYLITEGEIVLECACQHRAPIRLETIGKDDVLGWSWLVPPYLWQFDARATTRTKTIFFYGTWLRESCDRVPEFGYEMLKRMTSIMIRRLQATRRKLVETEQRCLS